MLRNYLKIAFINLVKNKVYSFINIGGLAVGLAACLCIGLYVQDEYGHDRFHRNFDAIYRITEIQKQADGLHTVVVTPGPLAPSLERDFAEITHSTRVGQWGTLLQHNGKKIEPKSVLIVDNAFFKIFDFKLLMGNPKTVFTNPDELVISEKLAEQFFGKNWQKNAILGQNMASEGQPPVQVVGVVANAPANSHLQFDALLPFKSLEKYDEWSMKWNSNSYHTYLQLKPQTNAAAFEQKITNYIAKYDKDNEATLHLQPLRDVYLRSKFDFGTDWGKRGDIFYVRIFLTVGLIVLLIAVANFVNLATARASKRAREVGVRKSVGARRSSLIWQFLGESLLMTTLAVLLALLIADSAMPLFNDLSNKTLHIPFGQFSFWATLLTATLSVTLFTGLYPAFFLSAFQPAKVLKGIFDARSGGRFRKTLVVGQFVLSVVLGIGTLVIYRQLNFMQNQKLGFDQSELFYLRLKGETRAKASVFKHELSRLSGVASVAATTNNLVDVSNSSTIEWQGQKPKDEFLITQMNVDSDFLTTTGMTLATGRNFSATVAQDTSDSFGRYLINETAAKRMGYTNVTALGKKVKFWGLEGEIIGVVKDFHFQSLTKSIEPFILRFRPKEFYFNVLVKTKPNNLNQTIGAIEKIHKKIDPNNPISYGFVDQDLEAQYRSEQRTGRIVLYFSVLAILIACLGLFGLATFTAEARTKEIGIRKVLGASVASIAALLSKDFLKLVLVAIVIGSPIAYYLMERWLSDFAYRTEIGWWIFATAGALSLLTSSLTIGYQAIRAALMNPVESLKTE